MTCCGGNCGCGHECKFGDSPPFFDHFFIEKRIRCKMCPGLSATQAAAAATENLVIHGGFTSTKINLEGSKCGCKCGGNCTCDPCKCNDVGARPKPSGL